MVTSWTDIPKASGTPYTKVPKPSGSGSSSSGPAVGSPIGLLLSLTYATTSSIITQMWTGVAKASGTSWTDIPKAT